MNTREKNLVILAAGLGTRFTGGIKQLQPVGPSDECIMEYSIYDALEAGFNRIVFIIRHDIQELFDENIGNRIRKVCAKRGVEVVCAYQEKTELPGGFVCPEDRAKPWGTGHALLSCRGLIHGGFVVVNADDYYGKEAFRLMSAFLDSLEEDSRGIYALAGFLLKNTLSENGGVTRGLCGTDKEGFLTDIRETKKILKASDGTPYVQMEDSVRLFRPETPVSMNMWAFTADVLEVLEERMVRFLKTGLHEPKSEFLIPTEVGGMLMDKTAKVQVISTPGQWFGMTFSADTPAVKAALAQMAEEVKYPDPLFG